MGWWGLHVKAEKDNVAVFHDVFFSFAADQALFLGGGHGAAGDQVVVGHHFGTDEAALILSFWMVQALTSGLPAVR